MIFFCLLLLFFVAGGVLAAGGLHLLARSGAGALPARAADELRYRKLPHYREGQFRNHEPVIHHLRKTPGIARLVSRFLTGRVKGPDHTLPVRKLTADDFAPEPADLRVCWLGHSMLILEIDGVRILTDPVFGNAAPLPGVVRRFQAPPLLRTELPPIDLVLISHDHYDHLEKATIRFLRQRDTPFLTPLGVGDRLRGWGIAPERIHEIDWNESFSFKALTVTARTTRHFSGRYLDDRNRTLWAAYAIAGPRHKVYFAGDGGYGEHFKTVGEADGPFDLTLLEIASWSEAWRNSHLFPEETIRAHLDLRGKALLPIHWAVFDLAFHEWDEPIERLVAAAEQAGVTLLTPKMGEAVEPRTPGEQDGWWRPPAARR